MRFMLCDIVYSCRCVNNITTKTRQQWSILFICISVDCCTHIHRHIHTHTHTRYLVGVFDVDYFFVLRHTAGNSHAERNTNFLCSSFPYSIFKFWKRAKYGRSQFQKSASLAGSVAASVYVTGRGQSAAGVNTNVFIPKYNVFQK